MSAWGGIVGFSSGISRICRNFFIKFVDFFGIMRIINTRMGMQKIKNSGSDPLADLQGRKVIVGAKQIKKALAAGQTNQVFLAENADPALTEPIAALCRAHNAVCVWVPDMTVLGHACGIEVGAAAAAVVSKLDSSGFSVEYKAT